MKIEFGLENEAYGGKINGSGFGGTLFLYSPEDRKSLFDKLKQQDINAYLIDITEGACEY